MFAPRSPQLRRLLADNAAAAKRATTREVALGAGALEAVAGLFARHFPGHNALVVSDDHTLAAAGEGVEAALLAADIQVRRVVLEPRAGDDHLVCEDGVIAAFKTMLEATPNAIGVAVGAGSVNDVVKYASHLLGREYACVPTAASMNGYTSTIAAILQQGVKRTLPCGQPVFIVADAAILAAAPSVLNRAGFGDLLSKPVSHGDWLLSHLVRGVPYTTAPNDVLDELFATLLKEAPAVGRADTDGLAVLMEAILISGFSMAIAGSSAPASGGEHLVSHYWDMEQLDHGAPLLGLHGTQVGIATRLSAMLFEKLLAIDPATIDPARLAARWSEAHAGARFEALASEHPTLSPAIVGEIRTQLQRKQKVGAELEAELTLVRDRWPEIRARIAAVMLGVPTIETALREAGCATRASDIGCDRARLIHTLRVCRHIRDRYVAFDLMDDLGLLEGWAQEVADAADAS